MASRKALKKKITYIASELFMASLTEGVDRETVIKAVHNILALLPRVSHAEPGNVKGFYKKLKEDLEKEVTVVANEMAKTAKA